MHQTSRAALDLDIVKPDGIGITHLGGSLEANPCVGRGIVMNVVLDRFIVALIIPTLMTGSSFHGPGRAVGRHLNGGVVTGTVQTLAPVVVAKRSAYHPAGFFRCASFARWTARVGGSGDHKR